MLVWPLVYQHHTRPLERRRGHARCARSVGYLEPACHDGFLDDVLAVVDYVPARCHRCTGRTISADTSAQKRSRSPARRTERWPGRTGTSLTDVPLVEYWSRTQAEPSASSPIMACLRDTLSHSPSRLAQRESGPRPMRTSSSAATQSSPNPCPRAVKTSRSTDPGASRRVPVVTRSAAGVGATAGAGNGRRHSTQATLRGSATAASQYGQRS